VIYLANLYTIDFGSNANLHSLAVEHVALLKQGKEGVHLPDLSEYYPLCPKVSKLTEKV
jgi:hypothetical protein